jgi:hypothetical protein
MGVLRILWFLFDAVRLHAKLVHLGRRSGVFFARRKAPQTRKQTSNKSCQNGSISPANLRTVRVVPDKQALVQMDSVANYIGIGPSALWEKHSCDEQCPSQVTFLAEYVWRIAS